MDKLIIRRRRFCMRIHWQDLFISRNTQFILEVTFPRHWLRHRREIRALDSLLNQIPDIRPIPREMLAAASLRIHKNRENFHCHWKECFFANGSKWKDLQQVCRFFFGFILCKSDKNIKDTSHWYQHWKFCSCYRQGNNHFTTEIAITKTEKAQGRPTPTMAYTSEIR